MRSWTDIRGRREATVAFCEFMNDPANEAIRARCCSDPEFAKRQFALVGAYYLEGETLPGQPPYDPAYKPIPRVVDFKVFNFEDPSRDNLVVLVLPERGKPIPDPVEVWRAGWPNWLA